MRPQPSKSLQLGSALSRHRRRLPTHRLPPSVAAELLAGCSSAPAPVAASAAAEQCSCRLRLQSLLPAIPLRRMQLARLPAAAWQCAVAAVLPAPAPAAACCATSCDAVVIEDRPSPRSRPERLLAAGRVCQCSACGSPRRRTAVTMLRQRSYGERPSVSEVSKTELGV